MKKFIYSLFFFCSFICSASAYEYKLAVLAIFQDDARFLKEWIEYHRLVGVEHFYLYNNLSKDNYAEVLAPYVQSGLVELYEWPFTPSDWRDWHSIQNSAYEDGLSHARDTVKWLAIIDSDEFLVPVKNASLLKVLEDYEKYGALAVHWQLYGTSDVAKVPPDQLMTETLLWKAPEDYSTNLFIKSIVRPERVERVASAHHMIYKAKYYAVNEKKERAPGMKLRKVSVDKIRINHYWTRDEDFLFNTKIARRSKDGSNAESHLKGLSALNTLRDPIMWRFSTRLRDAVFPQEGEHSP